MAVLFPGLMYFLKSTGTITGFAAGIFTGPEVVNTLIKAVKIKLLIVVGCLLLGAIFRQILYAVIARFLITNPG